jgi:hypothetical protein
MIRLVLIFALIAGPVFAQTRPVLRPDDLGQRVVVPEVDEGLSEAPQQAVGQGTLAAQLIAGLQPCWNVGALSAEAQAVQIVVGFEMAPDATPIRDTIHLVEFSQGSQDAADEALGAAFRAIVRCGREGLGLPSELYEQWQRVEVGFDASAAVTR